MGIREAIMNMALEKFTEELGNPNSDLSKKFTSMLYGNEQTGQKGTFDTLSEGGNSGGAITEDSGTGRVTTNDVDIKAKMKNYKRSIPQMIIDNVLPAGATVARTAGAGLNTYNSLLGDALIAVSNGLGSNGFDNPFAMAAALGLGKKAKGVVQGAILSGVGNIAENVGRDIKMEREKERETELLMREKPPGQFYDSRKQLTKNIYATSGDSSNINKNSVSKDSSGK